MRSAPKELAEEIRPKRPDLFDEASPTTALFSDKAQADAAAAKADAKKLEAERRAAAIDAGLHRQHVLGVPELHDGAERHLREVRHVRGDERV